MSRPSRDSIAGRTDEEDVLSVVVDELTMAMPVDVVDDDGAAVAERTSAGDRGIP